MIHFGQYKNTAFMGNKKEYLAKGFFTCVTGQWSHLGGVYACASHSGQKHAIRTPSLASCVAQLGGGT